MSTQVDPRRLIFLDESGVDTRMTWADVRAASRRAGIGKVPGGHWERLTVLGALGLEGVVASMSIAAATIGGVPGLRRAGPQARSRQPRWPIVTCHPTHPTRGEQRSPR